MTLKGILNGTQIDVLSTEYLVFLTPSVIGSFSVLVVSIVRWRHLNEQVHLLVQLSLADLLAALVLMYSSAINKVSIANSEIICQKILPLSLTFYFISSLLVVVYAWKSKSAIQGWRERPTQDESGQSQRTKITVIVCVIVWLIPIAMYIAYVHSSLIKASSVIPITDKSLSGLISNESKYCTSCILFLHVWRDNCCGDDRTHAIFIRTILFLIVISVISSCSVIYYKVGKWYERHEQEGLFPVEGDGRSRRRFRGVFSTARNMIMVVLFCWAPALVLILLSNLMFWTNIEQSSLFGLYMIQAAGVSLQGFLNSMVYAWRRPNFTEAVFGESTPLVAYNHVAFFDESLTSSS